MVSDDREFRPVKLAFALIGEAETLVETPPGRVDWSIRREIGPLNVQIEIAPTRAS